jgi:uncharacterized Ntn-hydrolase superfamily protein
MNEPVTFKILLVGFIIQSFVFDSVAQLFNKKEPFAHTFSIVARDSATGDLAVAVQSHWFSVGSTVSWAKAGVGVVATQSFIDKSYGPNGLKLMGENKAADEVLAALLQKDSGREVRQVAMIDRNGKVASHTGRHCIDFADHITGDNFSVQSNMMLNKTVCAAMAKAFQQSFGQPLAKRVLAALKGAQAAGGDIRGKQSAVLLVVSGNANIEPWNERLVDLRVDDNDDPIKELDRLLRLHDAYEHMNNGDLAVEKNDMVKAMNEYNSAMQMFPGNLEMKYWTAITLANNKEVNKAATMLQKIYQQDANWRELTKRLPHANLLTVSPDDFKLLIK